jgi:hypothetical protein
LVHLKQTTRRLHNLGATILNQLKLRFKLRWPQQRRHQQKERAKKQDQRPTLDPPRGWHILRADRAVL